MGFNAAKFPARDGFFNCFVDASFIALGMGKGKANEAIGMLGDNPRCIGVCLLIVAVEGRENHGFINACRFGSSEVGGDRGIGVPGSCQ